MSWAGRIVLRIPRVAGLNHEVPAVPVQTSAVNHILTIGVEAIPLAVEPVFEVTDEEVVVAHAEEAAVYALAVLETDVDGVQQFPLPILLAEDVFMGPSVPLGDRLPPGGAGNELCQFHSLSTFLSQVSVNLMIADIEVQTSAARLRPGDEIGRGESQCECVEGAGRARRERHGVKGRPPARFLPSECSPAERQVVISRKWAAP